MITSIYPQPGSFSSNSQKQGIRYPEDIQIILRADKTNVGNLFLSNVEAAQNPQILQSLQITAVLTAAKGKKLSHTKNIVKLTKYIPLDDDENCQLFDYLEESCNFIGQSLKKTNVLVHCVAGVSRSAALVIAFIMKERKLSLEDAYNEVKSRRKTICPSKNILQQLKRYEQTLNYKKVPTSRVLNTTLRMDTAEQKSAYKSFLKTKSFNQEEVNQSQQFRPYESRCLTEEFTDLKSKLMTKSRRSQRQDRKINIEVYGPRDRANPEDSILESKSRLQEPSILNKSIVSSRPRSQHQRSISQVPQNSQMTPGKRLSDSRTEFTKKMTRVDSINQKLNDRLVMIQDRFDTDDKAYKQNLDHELCQIYQMKSDLENRYANERKSRMTSRAVHNQTMEDKHVKEYILSSMTDQRFN